MNRKNIRLLASLIAKYFVVPVATLVVCMVCLMQPQPVWALILLSVVLAPLFGTAFFMSAIAARLDYWRQTQGYTRENWPPAN
jgi:hypothetical protein